MALTNNPVVLGGGSAESATTNITANSITAAPGSDLTLTAGAGNQNIGLIPTGTGAVYIPASATSGLQIYNTTDQITNFERFDFLWSGNMLRIIADAGGSGITRALKLQAGVNNASFTLGNTANNSFSFVGGTASSTNYSHFTSTFTSTPTSGTVVGVGLTHTYNQASGGAANTDLKIIRVETALGSGTQNMIQLFAGTTGVTEEWTVNNKGKQTVYSGVATTGWGSPAIYSSGRVTAQAAANASIATYTVGAADGSFRVSANMNVTASTAITTTLTCNYTDESNAARSMILPVTSLAGTFITAGAITGAGASVWETSVMHIRCKASTAITILTSAGTFTGVTYTAEGCIEQIA